MKNASQNQSEIVQLLRVLCHGQQELLHSNRRLAKVHDWWREQLASRDRQSRHRSRKAGQTAAAKQRLRECTVRNDARHSLLNSEATMMTARPRVGEAMAARLAQFVANVPTWLRMQAALDPRQTLVVLFSLYNHSFWEPWATSSGNNMRVFRDWREDGKPSFAFPPTGQVLPKCTPPQKWSDTAVVAFCESWFWKITTIVYRFVEDAIDLQDPDLGEFKALMDVTCAFSGYVTHRDLEWDPVSLFNWDRADALKAYRLVAPRLRVLREAFEKGAHTPLEHLLTCADRATPAATDDD